MKPSMVELEARFGALERSAGFEAKTVVLRNAALRMFGITHEPRMVKDAHGFAQITQGAAIEPDVRFESLQELYATCTGDTAMNYFGRLTQIANLPSFANLFQDALNRLLIQDYRVGYAVDRIARANSVDNFRALKRVRGKFVSDLATLEEDKTYGEVTVAGDEEVSYGGVITKGALLTVTRQAALNDDIGGIQRLVSEMARAAERTLAKRVWAHIIDNSDYSVDGIPMFDNAHGNLGSAALSVASLSAAVLAMRKQTESGSDEPLGLGSGDLLLAVPAELEPTARTIALSDQIGGQPNPWKGRLGPQGENIFVNPLFEDSDDWAVFDVSGNVSILEITYLNNRQMPEFVLAGSPGEGAGLTQDRIVWKLRHELEVGILDYRGAYKSEVSS